MPEMIPGIEFDFGGGQKRIIPPLSLGALERLQGGLSALEASAAVSPEAIKTVMEAAHAGLKRNYPSITKEEVGELVDIGNMTEVISCLMDVSGIKRKQIEADAKNQPAQTVTATPPLPGQD